MPPEGTVLFVVKRWHSGDMSVCVCICVCACVQCMCALMCIRVSPWVYMYLCVWMCVMCARVSAYVYRQCISVHMCAYLSTCVHLCVQSSTAGLWCPRSRALRWSLAPARTCPVLLSPCLLAAPACLPRDPQGPPEALGHCPPVGHGVGDRTLGSLTSEMRRSGNRNVQIFKRVCITFGCDFGH